MIARICLFVLLFFLAFTCIGQLPIIEYIHGSGLQDEFLPYEKAFKIKGSTSLAGDTIVMVVVHITGSSNAKYQSHIDNTANRSRSLKSCYDITIPFDSLNDISDKAGAAVNTSSVEKKAAFSRFYSRPRINGLSSLMYEQEYFWINSSHADEFEIIVSTPLQHDTKYNIEFDFLTKAASPVSTTSNNYINNSTIASSAFVNDVTTILHNASRRYISAGTLYASDLEIDLIDAFKKEVSRQEVALFTPPFHKFSGLIAGLAPTDISVALGASQRELDRLNRTLLGLTKLEKDAFDFTQVRSKINSDVQNFKGVPGFSFSDECDALIGALYGLDLFDAQSFSKKIGELAGKDFSDQTFLNNLSQVGSYADDLQKSFRATGIPVAEGNIDLLTYVKSNIEIQLQGELSQFAIAQCHPTYRVLSYAQPREAFDNVEAENDSRRLATDLSLLGFNFMNASSGDGRDVSFTLMSGAKIYFFPVAKKRPKPYGGWSVISEKRMSLVVGAIVSPLFFKEQEMQSLFKKGVNLKLYGGIGYDISKYFAFYAGVTLFRQQDPNPLFKESIPAIAPFIAFSIQTDILSLVEHK